MRCDIGKMAVAPPQQRKDGPCSPDVGLWRRILARAQEGNLTNHHFFVINVVEGCLHSSIFCTLSLPPLFMEHHRKRFTEHITLEGADGHRWLTMLALQLNSQYCLSIGWREFAADSNLEIDDKIVFLLFEDSHFLVQVFDANNNFKGRVVAAPAKGGDGKVSVVSQAPPARAGDGKVNVVSQAGAQQRNESSVAETTKTKPGPGVQAHRQGTNNPPLYFDTKTVNLSNDRTSSKVDSNPALRAESPSVPRSEVNGKGIIEIPDSSDEDEDEHMPSQPLPPTHWDGPVTSVGASGIKMRTEQTISRCSIKVTRVDAEPTQTQAPQKDVSDFIKRQTARQPSRIAEMAEPNNLTQKDVQSDEDQSEGATHIGNGGFKVPGTQPASRSPPSSSPEHVTVMKRPRKLQRMTAGDEEDDDDWTPRIRNSVETPTGQLKKDAAASKASKVTEQENKKNKKKKASTENLPKGMKRTPVTPPDSEVLNATQRAADDRGTEAMLQENGGSKAIPPQMPGGVGSRAPVQARHTIKANKKREKACLPPEESRPPPEEEPKIQYKRPKMTSIRPARIGTLKARREHKFLFISRRRPVTEQERAETLAKAQEYARKSINKHFVMQLRETQVYCGYHLGVPHEFVEAMQLPLARQRTTFFDINGKTWDVDWQGDDHPKFGFNSTGWVKFVLDHFLEGGDVCVFELPDPKVFNISVTIFPIVPLANTPELGWRSHYGGEHTGEKSEVAAQSQC